MLNESLTHAYRGMSNEEWQEALQRGYILSDCRFAPYEHQDEMSCFGSYKDAEYYATELPIEGPENIEWEWRSQTKRSMPYTGIVIEVPQTHLKNTEQDPRVHEGEYWAFGKLPLNTITRAWEFRPTVDGETVRFTKRQII